MNHLSLPYSCYLESCSVWIFTTLPTFTNIHFKFFFFFSSYFSFPGKKFFFHLLPDKLGVQMTATVTPQRLGAGTHPPHSLAAPFSQFLSTELFYSLILFFLLFEPNWGLRAPNLPSIRFRITKSSLLNL